jgi:hypothetical protein
LVELVRKYWAKCLPWPPTKASWLLGRSATSEPYTILIMLYSIHSSYVEFLPPRCSPANKATGLRPDNFAPLLWQFFKLNKSALQSLAVAGYQTACTRRLLPCCSGRILNCQLQCSGRIPNCMHVVAVANTKLPLAVTGY